MKKSRLFLEILYSLFYEMHGPNQVVLGIEMFEKVIIFS